MQVLSSFRMLDGNVNIPRKRAIMKSYIQAECDMTQLWQESIIAKCFINKNKLHKQQLMDSRQM